ncbi:MAG: hypothetical protein Q7R47_00920 [Candidatus Diapherotrites archaeon]|nr:hypothetical protein [Candidatus Diapherotrites archaeon]
MDYRTTGKDLFHLALLVGLVLGLLGLLTWTGVMRCGAIPGWCDAYYMVVRGGPPRVLIVYGLEGMGDPELLRAELASPQHVGVQAAMERLDSVNLDNIKRYDLVIVEHARTISTGKLKMFMEYATSGGRLVWTGDAGSVLAPGDTPLLAGEDPSLDINAQAGDPDAQVVLNPWRRKEGTRIIAFDEFLSVRYLTSYCDIKDCFVSRPWQGLLRTTEGSEHRLVYGLRQGLVLRGDFAVVQSIDSVPSTRVLTLDWESDLITKTGVNIGRVFPIIQTGGVGERVAYYAVPPEQFVAPDLPEKYYTILENVYYGMIK